MNKLERTLRNIPTLPFVENAPFSQRRWLRILCRGWQIERARTARLRKLVRLYEEKAPADVVDRVESLMEEGA